jgi:hypothetical protein
VAPILFHYAFFDMASDNKNKNRNKKTARTLDFTGVQAI